MHKIQRGKVILNYDDFDIDIKNEKCPHCGSDITPSGYQPIKLTCVECGNVAEIYYMKGK